MLEGDKGKNTGGMGAYSPSRLINIELEKKILNKIINPTLKALKDMGTDYKGFLSLLLCDSWSSTINTKYLTSDPRALFA